MSSHSTAIREGRLDARGLRAPATPPSGIVDPAQIPCRSARAQ